MATRFVLILMLLGAALASAKTYNFTLSNAAQAGSTKLDPGQYSIRLDGDKVILKDAAGHEVSAAAKVESADHAFRDTEVSATNANGTNHIEWIGLGGSKSKVIFQ